MLNDLRLAARDLIRHPGFTLLAVLTLAVGIGGSAAIFSVVDHVVLRPMPYPNGDRMAYVSIESPPEVGQFLMMPSLALARDLTQASHSFEAVELYQAESRVTSGPDGAESISVLHVQPTLFGFLDARPRIGRTFGDPDMQSDAPNVALISHGLWKTRYGGDASVLEQDIRLDEQLYRIVGVMRPGFRVPRGTHEVWLPLRADGREPDTSRRVTALGVLKQDAGLEAATGEMVGLARALQASDALLARGFQPRAIPPAEFSSATLRRSSLVLFGAVGLLLMIGCANVAALLVTRHAGRARDVAIRRALGATRLRLIHFHVAEALLLGAGAGLAGVLIAMWTLDAVREVMPARLLPSDVLEVNTVVLAFTAAISLLTTVAFGLLPALQGTRVDLTSAMRSDARSGGTTRGRHLTRRFLTAAEVALAVVLLVGAGLLVRSFVELQRTPLGFDPSGIISASVMLPVNRYPDDESRRAFLEQLLGGARVLPGVTAAALASGLPPSTGLLFGDLRIDGEPEASGKAPSPVSASQVSDEYFSAMRISIRHGRGFGPQDSLTAERVAVVNENFARRVWPDQDPVGRRMTFGAGPEAAWMTVVGVAADVKANAIRPMESDHGGYQLYQSIRQTGSRGASVVLRADGDATRLGPDLRALVRRLDPLLPLQAMQTGEERIAVELAGERFNLLLLGLFAGVGLVLAATGIYGMMALYVAHRRHEIGVRLALGATPGAVASLIVRQSLVMAAAGLAAGVIGALWLTRFMQALLHGVDPADPLTLASVVLVIATISIVATIVPVRRALGVAPADALRIN